MPGRPRRPPAGVPVSGCPWEAPAPPSRCGSRCSPASPVCRCGTLGRARPPPPAPPCWPRPPSASSGVSTIWIPPTAGSTPTRPQSTATQRCVLAPSGRRRRSSSWTDQSHLPLNLTLLLRPARCPPGASRAPDHRLRHRGTGGRGARRCRGGPGQGAGPVGRRVGGSPALAAPAPVGNGGARPGLLRWPGGGGIPRSDPAHAQHHRAAPAVGRAGGGRRRARPGRAAVRHRHPSTGHPRGDGRPGRTRHRVALPDPRPRCRRPRPYRGGDGRRGPRPDRSPLRGGGRPYRHRVRGAALLRRVERGTEGVCPGLAATATILEAHSPTRMADARIHLDGHRRQSGPRKPSPPPPPCAHPTCRWT